jgi:hypothetical protein
VKANARARCQAGEVFAERFELGESEIQFGVNRFDDLEHFRRCFAKIGCAFA